MKRFNYKLWLWLCTAVLLLAACDSSDNNQSQNATTNDTETAETTATRSNGIQTWLQEVKAGEIDQISMGQTLDWGLGYLLYYGNMEGIGVDNLIYNGLVVQRQLELGEVAEANLSQRARNLLAITDGVQHNPDVALTEQVGQTPEVRQAIMSHIVPSQQDLTPQEALASGNIIGVVAPPAPDSLGEKYLVYGQATPDADFSFLGVVMAADATTQNNSESYSFEGWEGLPWLGDAAGPFWDSLPAGVSGDPANIDEGRPGVLVISEATYDMIK